MTRRVVLKIGEGSFATGFPVTLEIGEDGSHPTTQAVGKLPPLPEMPLYYEHWRSSYERLGLQLRISAQAFPVNPLTLKTDCESAAQILKARFNTWLRSEEFRPIWKQWIEEIRPTDEVRVGLQTDHSDLQKLPWHLWELLEECPKAELALCAHTFKPSTRISHRNRRVKILAILGDSRGIDTEADRTLLEKLPGAEVTFLVEPRRQDLTEHLWSQPWDILFFAGHSCDRGSGRMFINKTDDLTIAELKYALQKAVSQGLQLAIFNSCEGLGLARDLADLHIPQTILMREPVPDRVAQEFLKYFLTAFANGEKLYLAVRSARERLQGLEDQFPCATWLPVIFQNLAEIPPTWVGLTRPKSNWIKPLAISLLAAGAIVGVRYIGLLQPWELKAYDAMLQLRSRIQPALQPISLENRPDPRIIVIEINDKDLRSQQQQSEPLQDTSLSNTSLIRLLDVLKKYPPRVIGLDLKRDPKSMPVEVRQRFQRSANLIGICKSRSSYEPGFPPPAGLSPQQIGFSDAVKDADKVFRRQILSGAQHSDSPCPWIQGNSFSMQVALRYLQVEGIYPQLTSEGYLQLGSTIFRPLHINPGAYQREQNVDGGGDQILLNYRAAGIKAIELTEVLQEQTNLQMLKDRVVLIGATYRDTDDVWLMPFSSGNPLIGSSDPRATAGVFMQAQQVSQILSAVLDQRPLIWVWSWWGETAWIVVWVVGGGLLVGLLKFPTAQLISMIAVAVALFGTCFGIFLAYGGWVPVVPIAGALALIGGSVVLQRKCI